jgi:hypothetical protein
MICRASKSDRSRPARRCQKTVVSSCPAALAFGAAAEDTRGFFPGVTAIPERVSAPEQYDAHALRKYTPVCSVEMMTSCGRWLGGGIAQHYTNLRVPIVGLELLPRIEVAA